MNRYFFALTPPADTRNSILFQRDKLHISGNLTKENNLHITLIFLGRLTQNQVTKIIEKVSDIQSPPFEITINKTGFFKKSGAFWLGPEHVPVPLMNLQQSLLHKAQACNICIREQDYTPHVTLSRKSTCQKPQTISPIIWSVDDFALFKSIDTPNGVLYKNVKCFTFNSDSN